MDPADLVRFKACLPLTLAQECPHPDDWSNPKNFSDDAHDPGGKTMCGITQREYDHYRKARGLAVQDVRKITAEEGEDIYDKSYWLPDCPALPAGLDLCLFDASVNQGAFEAVKILQRALGVAADGDWGSKTAAAVHGITAVSVVIRRFTTERRGVYRELKGFPYFGTDWLRRAQEIGDAALEMAAAPASAPGPGSAGGDGLVTRIEGAIKKLV